VSGGCTRILRSGIRSALSWVWPPCQSRWSETPSRWIPLQVNVHVLTKGAFTRYRMDDSKKTEVMEMIKAQRERIFLSFKTRLEVDLAKVRLDLEFQWPCISVILIWSLWRMKWKMKKYFCVKKSKGFAIWVCERHGSNVKLTQADFSRYKSYCLNKCVLQLNHQPFCMTRQNRLCLLTPRQHLSLN